MYHHTYVRIGLRIYFFKKLGPFIFWYPFVELGIFMSNLGMGIPKVIVSSVRGIRHLDQDVSDNYYGKLSGIVDRSHE